MRVMPKATSIKLDSQGKYTELKQSELEATKISNEALWH